MESQSLFSGKNKKNINLSSAELAESVVKVKMKINCSCENIHEITYILH